MTSNNDLGLEKLGGFDLSVILESGNEKFKEIELGAICEDGSNPRHTFDQSSLLELAETIRARGVITPISVRPDPDRSNGYIVNHGHRRLRAAKMAGLTVIPAVIDESFKDEDRIIENIQRDNLEMFDVAKFIAKKLAEGLKQKDVARLIGKSTAYVSHHVVLLELPPHTKQAVQLGRVVDLTTIANLAKIERHFPKPVQAFLANGNDVTRTTVQHFRDGLKKMDGVRAAPESNAKEEPFAKGVEQEQRDKQFTKIKENNEKPFCEESSSLWRGGAVIVEMDKKRGILRLDKRPKNERYVWVEWEDGDEAEREVALSCLTLVAVVSW